MNVDAIVGRFSVDSCLDCSVRLSHYQYIKESDLIFFFELVCELYVRVVTVQFCDDFVDLPFFDSSERVVDLPPPNRHGLLHIRGDL